MKTIHGPLRVASLGTLALTLLMAGCNGGSPGFGGVPAGPNLTPVGSNVVPGGAQIGADQDIGGPGIDGRRHRHPTCKTFSITQDFTNKKILAGRWLWFSSVISGKDVSNNEILVRDASITITTNRRQIQIRVPNMRMYVRGYRRPRLGYRSGWIAEIPAVRHGHIFADGVSYKLANFMGTGTKSYTWSARFYAKHDEKFSWASGAAVYTQFSDRPDALRVKPTRYSNGKAEAAGTPLGFTQYLVAGGTGKGDKDYTGELSKPVEVTPCR